MRELFPHAVHRGEVNKITSSLYLHTTINEREREAYLEAGTKTMTKAWSAICFLPLLLFFFRLTSVFGFLCLVSSCPSPVLCVFRSPMALCFCSSSLYYLCSYVLLCSRCYFLSGSRETEAWWRTGRLVAFFLLLWFVPFLVLLSVLFSGLSLSTLCLSPCFFFLSFLFGFFFRSSP
jgi:hypothetical protein